MSQERRSEPRIETKQLRLIAYDSLAEKLFGSVTNLSSNGLMLLGNNQVDVGGIIQLDLRRAAATQTPLLEVAVTVSWTRAAQTPGNYWVGTQIIGITEQHALALQQLIEEAMGAGAAISY